jgi:hypothetical protein
MRELLRDSGKTTLAELAAIFGLQAMRGHASRPARKNFPTLGQEHSALIKQRLSAYRVATACA